jgi:hypothetical protein
MQNLRLTTRGWIVLALAAVTVSVLINWALAGKNLACDWRQGPTTCSVEVAP